MKIEEIRTVAEQRPFRPFIFHLNKGRQYVIHHPEIIITDFDHAENRQVF